MKKLLSIIVAVALAVGVMAAAPKGETITLRIDESIIYPGTHRTVKVYVPEQYDGKTPACMVLRMDGEGHNLSQIIDELIEEGSMPVTIAIYITSGIVYDESGEVVRYNRSNEFDRMTATWAEFIESEVIPAVEKLRTSDGRKIMVSRNPADRAITGDSSGGICAFNAAWQRPDLYSRVYSIVGTFVPMRGGDSFPALIRKTEPKPLRIWLQDNDQDSWNMVFGSWFEYNLLMASSLRYAGYDLATTWNEGGHSGTNGGRIMKDVMRWLWAGWPDAINPRFGDNALINSLVIPEEGWKICDVPSDIPWDAFRKAVYPGGGLVARPKPHTSAVMTWVVDSQGNESCGQDFCWLHQEGGVDDSDRYLAYDSEGWLYVSSALGIQVCDHNGRVRGVLCSPAGRIEAFAFVGNTVYVKIGNTIYSRVVGHRAALPSDPRPVSQGMG